VLWTQLTTFPLEIIAPDEKQFGTEGGMSRTNAYDLVIIGGGIAGSSLACSMAKAGARVLLLESEIEFRDRVRGEILCPW
jgi:NADPH-dependent 2,4-dienoyl-CoA reductase/sulfur reductase-like enzyme